VSLKVGLCCSPPAWSYHAPRQIDWARPETVMSRDEGDLGNLIGSEPTELVVFKNGRNLSEVEQIAYTGLRIGQFQFALRPAGGHIDTHQRAQAGAINVVNSRKIQHDPLGVRDNSADGGLEVFGGGGGDSAGPTNDGLITVLFHV
jgi:hypothetical protein